MLPTTPLRGGIVVAETLVDRAFRAALMAKLGLSRKKQAALMADTKVILERWADSAAVVPITSSPADREQAREFAKAVEMVRDAGAVGPG